MDTPPRVSFPRVQKRSQTHLEGCGARRVHQPNKSRIFKQNKPIDPNQENNHASSADASVAPVAALTVSAPANPNPSSNVTVSAAAPVAASTPVIAARGITEEDIAAVEAALATSEEIVNQWPIIRPEERRRVKVNSVKAADFRAQIGGLSEHQSEKVPGLPSNDQLAPQQAIVEHLQSLERRSAAFSQRLKDAVAMAARDYQSRLSVAYFALKVASRHGGTDLKAQVKRAGLRYQRKKAKAAGANPTPTPTPAPAPTEPGATTTPTSPGGKPPTSPA